VAAAKLAAILNLILFFGQNPRGFVMGAPSTAALRAFGVFYALVLAYYVYRHFVTWRLERERIRRAIAAFKVLLLATAGASAYFSYQATTRGTKEALETSQRDGGIASLLTSLGGRDKAAKMLVASALLTAGFYRGIVSM